MTYDSDYPRAAGDVLLSYVRGWIHWCRFGAVEDLVGLDERAGWYGAAHTNERSGERPAPGWAAECAAEWWALAEPLRRHEAFCNGWRCYANEIPIAPTPDEQAGMEWAAQHEERSSDGRVQAREAGAPCREWLGYDIRIATDGYPVGKDGIERYVEIVTDDANGFGFGSLVPVARREG